MHRHVDIGQKKQQSASPPAPSRYPARGAHQESHPAEDLEAPLIRAPSPVATEYEVA
jgi:hypothetical protein